MLVVVKRGSHDDAWSREHGGRSVVCTYWDSTFARGSANARSGKCDEGTPITRREPDFRPARLFLRKRRRKLTWGAPFWRIRVTVVAPPTVTRGSRGRANGNAPRLST